MAGGNGVGAATNQLLAPSGLWVSDDGSIYVADKENHRVVKWGPGVSSGRVVAGNGIAGNHSDQFDYVSSIVIDKNGTMFMCDAMNMRVQRWFPNDHRGQTIIANVGCWGLALDLGESLYITDNNQARVTKWPGNEKVAGGNGVGSALNQFSGLHHVFVDGERSIFWRTGITIV